MILRSLLATLLAVTVLVPSPAAAGPDDLAIVIANRNYSNGAPLRPFAHHDGDAFAKAAVDVLAVERARVRLHRDTTAAALRQIFARDGEAAALLRGRPGARLVVYYSGHGVPQASRPLLLPIDASAAKAEDDGYPLRRLIEDARGLMLGDGQLIVVVEAAFGSVDGDAWASGLSRKGLAVFLAAGGVGTAYADEPSAKAAVKGRAHGVFTDAILDGLYGLAAGPARTVSIGDLQRFATRRIADRLAVLHPGEAKTQLPRVVAGDPALVIARLPSSPVHRDPTSAAIEDRECRLLVSETDPAPIDAFLASCRLCLCADALKAHARKLRETSSAANADCEADRQIWARYHKGDAARIQQFIDVARCPSVVAEAKAALAAAVAASTVAPAAPAGAAPLAGQIPKVAMANEQTPKAQAKGAKSGTGGEVTPTPKAPATAGSDIRLPATGRTDGSSRQQAPDPGQGAADPPRPSEEGRIQLVKSIHKELRRVGCEPGGQPVWGKSLSRALEAFQRSAKTRLELETPSAAILAALQSRKGRVCPLTCDDDEIVVNNECRPRPAPKTAAPKASSPKAAERKRPVPKAKAQDDDDPPPKRKAQHDDPPPKKKASSGPAGSGGDCPSVMFNGQVCTDGRGRTCVQRFHQRVCTY